MPIKHLTRGTGGHLQKHPTSGHLVKLCYNPPPGTGCLTSCNVTPDPQSCWRWDSTAHLYIQDKTPDTQEVTITSWMAGKNDWDAASPYHIFKTDLSGIIGVALCLLWTGSLWTNVFDVTGLIKLLRCYGSFPNNPTKCTPTTDISTAARLTATVGVGGVPNFRIEFQSSDTEWAPPLTWRDAVMDSMLGMSTSFADCCTAYTVSGGTYPGTEDPPSGIVTGMAVVPCCTP